MPTLLHLPLLEILQVKIFPRRKEDLRLLTKLVSLKEP